MNIYTRATGTQITENAYQAFKVDHLAVRCPACGASKGTRCYGKSGAMVKGTHRVRVDRLRERAA